MKLLLALVTTLFLVATPVQTTAMTAMEPVFYLTHMCPSPITTSAGRLTYGTELAFGVTDFFQVGTNLLRDFYQIFNANAKLGILNGERFAAGLLFQAQTYNMRAIDPAAANIQVSTFQPGIASAISLVPGRVAWFIAGQFNIEQTSSAGSPPSGYLTGTLLQSDLTWAYSVARTTKTGARIGGNALAAGISFDVTYAQFGIGLSHHWPGFHLGIHYYPNGGNQKVLPILTGGGSVQF